MPIFAPESVSFPDKDRETLKLWERLDAFEESNRRAVDRPLFTFYDGPPFATGLPHYGHILAGTIKDTVTRFAYQSGYRVPRRFGWDCHGLPVEYEIDQALNVRSRDDVLRIGLTKYNDACRSIVMRYSAEWEAIVKRIGRWIDFERGYRTMDLSFMESVWWAFSELHRQGLVYRGFRVMPYSTACSTPLSNFEANLNYKDVQDPAVTVSFPVVGDADSAELVAWTTTPWTLPSNVALCVHPELEYVRLCDNMRDGRVLVVAAARIGELFKGGGGGGGPAAAAKAQARGDYQVLARMPGTALVGCHYQPMFDYFVRHSGAARLHDAFRVVADTFVTADSGTGIVHLAPAFGEDDFRICTREGIVQRNEAVTSATTAALPCPVDDDGRFTEPVTDLAGVYIKDADRELIRRIKAAGRLIKHDTYQHSYPFCWRSDTPLIYRAVPSWFVAVERIRDRLVACNATTRWVPASTGEHRFGNWLANARDWNVSRNRYWGTPLPIWQSEDGSEVVVIGSIAELEQRAGLPPGTVRDLHRQHVDDIRMESRTRPGTYLRRVEEVFDCWFESGAMPYGSHHYPFAVDEAAFLDSGLFPANFIAEGQDQTRGWFYTLMVLGVALFDRAPFQNVIVNGLVLAEDGKKMSKRLKNYPDPMAVVERYGADALRLYLIQSPVVRGETLRFRESGVRDMVRDVLLPWYNAYRFFVQNASPFLQAFAAADDAADRLHIGEECLTSATPANAMDKWIQSLLSSLIEFVRDEMQAYRLYTVVPRLLWFIESLTNGYVRMNRPRLRGAPEVSRADQAVALTTLGEVLLTLCILMAPFAPFTSEWLYQNMRQFVSRHSPRYDQLVCASVHFVMMPPSRTAAIDRDFEQAVAHMQQAILLGRTLRERHGIALKQPLRRARIVHRDEQAVQRVRALEHYVRLELNVHDVEYSTDEARYLSYRAVPDGKVLGPRLGAAFPAVARQVRGWSSAQVMALQRRGSVQLSDPPLQLQASDVFIQRDIDRGHLQTHEDVEADSASGVTLVLDLSLDETLVLEGWVREVVNRVQRLRKKIGLVPSDAVEVFVGGGGEGVARVLQERAEEAGAALGGRRLLPYRALDTVRRLPGVAVAVLADEPVDAVQGEAVRLALVRAGLWPNTRSPRLAVLSPPQREAWAAAVQARWRPCLLSTAPENAVAGVVEVDGVEVPLILGDTVLTNLADLLAAAGD